ncbi:MAG: hypothetical protein WD672_03745 [Woeseia sp.]
MDQLIQLADQYAHKPLLPDIASAPIAIGAALLFGLVLSLYFKISRNDFFLWAFFVGALGLIFMWLLLSVLPVKWAIILLLVIVYPIALMAYVDNKSWEAEMDYYTWQQNNDANDDDDDGVNNTTIKIRMESIKANALAASVIGYLLIAYLAFLVYLWPNPSV